MLGAIGSARSIRAALVGSTLLMGPVIALFGRSLVRNEHHEPVLAADGE